MCVLIRAIFATYKACHEVESNTKRSRSVYDVCESNDLTLALCCYKGFAHIYRSQEGTQGCKRAWAQKATQRRMKPGRVDAAQNR